MLTGFSTSLIFLIRALTLSILLTSVLAGLVALLWNWQLANLTSLPNITFWQSFAVVGVFQLLKIKL